jgi:molybdate transport system regulatory protein
MSPLIRGGARTPSPARAGRGEENEQAQPGSPGDRAPGGSQELVPAHPDPGRLLLDGAAGLGHIGLDEARELDAGERHLKADGNGFSPSAGGESGSKMRLMKPKLRVWVMFGDELKFGDGRARLFELIEERGSLKKAAQELEMSYRNAWGYLRDLEEAAGFKFVERVPGGGPASGMRLTKAGKRFLERYKKFRSGLDDAAKRQFERAFGA